MIIEIEKEQLLYAVSAVERAISSKNTISVLGGIMITARDNNLLFRATDLELSIECSALGQIVEEGEIVAPGKKFASLVRLLPNTSITLKTKGENMEVLYGSAKLMVPCLSGEEFPLFPEARGAVSGSLPAPVFRRMVRQVGVAAAQDEIRPVFTAVLTEFGTESITMVATDTHRLSKSTAEFASSTEKTLLIPNRSLQEAARLAASDNDDILIQAGENQVFFSFANLTLTTRLIMGQYPDYRQVVPNKDIFTTEVVVSRTDLIESLERAALVSGSINRGKGHVVTLIITEQGFSLAAESADQGMLREPLPAMVSGQAVEINYNGRYLQDVLKVLEEENVRLLISGATTPGLVLPEDEHSSYLYLLLPVRVSKPS